MTRKVKNKLIYMRVFILSNELRYFIFYLMPGFIVI